MNTWRLARALVGICESPQDVNRVLRILKDRGKSAEVYNLLSNFSEHIGDQRHTPARRSRQTTHQYSKDVERLARLFRDAGMTNLQVEQWLKSRFTVDQAISKDSLKKYLNRVMRFGNNAMSGQIAAVAYREFVRGPNNRSEVEEYWDSLDRKMSTAE